MKSSLAYLTGNIIWALIPYLLLPFLTRELSVANMGIISIFTIFGQILTIIIGVNSFAALQTHFHGLQGLEKNHYITANLFVMFGVFVCLLFFSILMALLINDNEIFPMPLVVLSVLLGFGQALVQYFLSIIQMLEKVRYYILVQISQAVLNGLLTIIFILWISDNYQGRVYPMVFSIFIILIPLVIIVQKIFPFNWNNSIVYIKKMLRFGLPLMPHSLSTIVIATVDRNLLATILGINETGLYSVALQIALGFSLIADAFNKAYSVFVYKHLHNNQWGIVKKSIVQYAIIWVIFIVISYFLMPLLMPIIVGEKYISAVQTTQFLIIGMCFGGLYYLFTNILFFYQKTSQLSVISVVCGILNVPLAYYLIKFYGLNGAAWAYNLTQLFIFVAVMVVAIKIMKHHKTQ